MGQLPKVAFHCQPCHGDSITETPEIPSFLQQGGELPYLSSPAHWTLAEKSPTDRGPKSINSNFRRSPRLTCSDSNLTWFDLSLATDHWFFISSLSLLTGSLISLMASPDWYWNIFFPHLQKNGINKHFLVLPQLCSTPQSFLTSPAAEHFPSWQAGKCSKTPFKSLTPCPTTNAVPFYTSLKKYYSAPATLHSTSGPFPTNVLSLHIFFLPLPPERPWRRLDRVELLPLIPKQSFSEPVCCAVLRCPVSTSRVFGHHVR